MSGPSRAAAPGGGDRWRDLRDQLDLLLAESPVQARERALDGFSFLPDTTIVLYGAGVIGRAVLGRLRQAGIEPAAFADDAAPDAGRRVDGVAVITPGDAARRFGSRTLFVVSMLNPRLPFRAARRRLRTLTSAPVVSFVQLAWALPGASLPSAGIERPDDILADASGIRRAFECLADDESRGDLVAHLRFRLHLDYDALPERLPNQYFPAIVPALGDRAVFVDGGAYDGDTMRAFLARQDGRFSCIHAFEPDRGNCGRLRDAVAALPADIGGRIHVYHAALGETGSRAAFRETGDMSAALQPDGGSEVDVLALDDVVRAGDDPVYIKLDIEGGERDALAGSGRLIAACRPLLAISAYHRPGDLWRLPLWAASLGAGYRVYLRTHGEDGMDAICYAIRAFE